ncbi:hypothetical protein EJB05_31635 [Eragrostis curvula]|uniref:AB hydrolase-1 domain-containing protein n=1 Tax=Eragrostis curvula TaxID=38414 RepID=A0A5J9UE23_9POAL|nr:hypothetical protein EJB05_31635 [Eragrostis curvula]
MLMRLLPLLLLLFPTSLREYYIPAASNRRQQNDAVGDELLHPIVLIPGASCSELEARLTDAYRPTTPRCGVMKGKGWFGLWQNCSDLPAHRYVPCFMEQMRLVYDPTTNDFRNLPGVETRVPNFGSSTGFHRDPIRTGVCLAALRPELERLGYRDGDTLFGAAYDFRHAPPIPGQPSRLYARYFRQLAALVEDASRKRCKKVVLLGHSFGGMVALEFVRAKPPAWREKYIKHLVLVAPLPASGFMESVKFFISGSDFLYVPATTALSLRPVWRSLETAIVNFPSPAVFGDDTPLVITNRRNYTARDMADLLSDVGAADAVEPFRRRRELPKARYFQAPMVPVTCINGVGVETPEQVVYWDGDFDAEPEVVYGDGDETVNLVSMLAFDEEMRRQPGQRKQYKSIKLPGARHGNILTQEWSLKRVIQEILEANRMSLVYDSDANEFRNIPGVETRVPNFGSTVFQRNPEHTDWCLEALKNELEHLGYRDGETLFGAAYDLRHAPPIPVQPSRVFARYFRQLTALIEDASRKQRQGLKKVILFGHSFGATVALEFARAAPPAWREKYIERLFLVAPLPASGFLQPLQYFISGSYLLYVPTTSDLAMRPMWRSFESAIVNFPSPAVFGDAKPLVITPRRNYTARDTADLLVDVGADDAVEPFRRRAVPIMRYFQAPMVPVTCVNGAVDNRTPEQLVYRDGDFDKEPEVVYGDGDGTINLDSMLAFDEEMRREPGRGSNTSRSCFVGLSMVLFLPNSGR